jgi:hypothetical protein
LSELTTQAPSQPALRLSQLRRPPFAIWFPLAVYAATRLVDALFILIAARHQIALSGIIDGYLVTRPSPSTPGYATVASNWDGQWFMQIANVGYPKFLPRDSAGSITMNAWAFPPAYPILVRALMAATGTNFYLAASSLSLVLGAGAVIVMFHLMQEVAGRFTACATTLLTCTFLASPVLQLAYSDSLALLLVCLSLVLLRAQRYVWLSLGILVLALTKPIGLALTAVIVIHWLWRYKTRASAPFGPRDQRRVASSALLSIAATGIWPAIAAFVTGVPSAYLQSELAWGLPGQTRILTAWFHDAWARGGAGGLALLLFVVLLVAGVVIRSGAGSWGVEVRAWAATYPMYLLLVTTPQSSILRLLIFAFPLLWPFPEPPKSTTERRLRFTAVLLMALGGLALQWVWVSELLIVSHNPPINSAP